ncbi:MAG: hypothetical protein FWE62_05795 [Firmicutes bacterium]|nr:hypothetical protein [Bacillota bacterium]
MHKITRLAVACLLIVCAAFAGACGDGKFENRDDTLYVVSINKGYGVKWLEDNAAAFESKNPGIKVKITPVYDDSTITDTLESGEKYCNYDLMFTGMSTITQSPSLLADLTDLYNYTIPGRSAPVKEVMILRCARRFHARGRADRRLTI